MSVEQVDGLVRGSAEELGDKAKNGCEDAEDEDAATEEKPDVEHGLRRGSWTIGPQAEFGSLWHGQGPDDLARRSGQRSVGLDEEVVTRTRCGRRKHAELGAAEGLAALVVRNAGTV